MSGVDISSITPEEDNVIPVYRDDESNYGIFRRVVDERPEQDDSQSYDPSSDPSNYQDKRLEISVREAVSKLDIP